MNRMTESWVEVERPVGPMPTPSWCKDVHINWMDGLGNSPEIRLKTDGTEGDWPGKCFTYHKGGVYIAKHEDGRLECHGHDGAVTMGKVKMFRRADGELAQHRRWGHEWGHLQEPGILGTDGLGRKCGHEPGEWVEVDHLVTTQQQGYAGRGFRILRDDGQYVMLRGPWHIGAPAGYVGVITVDCSEPDAWIARRRLKWWNRTGCFGLFLRQDALINIISRYQAHIRLAFVTHSYGGPYLEPLKPEWNAPKGFKQELENV
jgi:hypothetical protein